MSTAGDPMLRILYVGQTWNGSSARSMREALSARQDVELDDIGEDLYFPRHGGLILRGARRLLAPLYRAELSTAIRKTCASYSPDVLVVYRGGPIHGDVVTWARSQGILTANVFPDYSPHAYGPALRDAIGRYDLVISTKPFHPAGWQSVYGYDNECVFVPHGYDPAVHLWTDIPARHDIDVAIAANWRKQYEEMLLQLASFPSMRDVSLALAGPGWDRCRSQLPQHWQVRGPLHGRSYGEFLRSARIVIAPVHRDVRVGRVSQPGDEDTTRTYELAAAGCFFVHRRTPYVQTVYDESSEVPMWDDATELARLIEFYLPRVDLRAAMAERAHRRAVPAYSVDARAGEVVRHVREHLGCGGSTEAGADA